ncbi:MAG: PDZ domain-containing protein [Immundisolibacter sp.]|uniref:PDZ domain-containing protein n=1 Tax=Immundisolibacter sp. TaxID=1934948 RepID=UPI003EE1F3B1
MNFAIKVAIFVLLIGGFRLYRLLESMPPETQSKAILGLLIAAVGLAIIAYSAQWLFDKLRFYIETTSHQSDIRFGVRLINLNEKFRKKHQSNTGALVKKVFEGSPAFYSNVLPGDVILEIDEKRIVDAEAAILLLEDANKWPRQIALIRNGRKVTIQMDYEQFILDNS